MSDFTTLPDGLEPPVDDGAARHLMGRDLPHVVLPATRGAAVDLASLHGLALLYFYPLTGRPGTPLPGGWNEIPGARGCTPQACSFRDSFLKLQDLGVRHLFGISTQTTAYQREAAERLDLPFPLLSDSHLELMEMLDLPSMEVDGERLFKRLTMLVRDGRIETLYYPVFPPDQNALEVMQDLRNAGGGHQTTAVG